MEEKTVPSCSECMSVEICPLRGEPCYGWNDPHVFRGLLKMLSPNTNWDEVFKIIEEDKIRW